MEKLADLLAGVGISNEDIDIVSSGMFTTVEGGRKGHYNVVIAVHRVSKGMNGRIVSFAGVEGGATLYTMVPATIPTMRKVPLAPSADVMFLGFQDVAANALPIILTMPKADARTLVALVAPVLEAMGIQQRGIPKGFPAR